MVTKPLQLEGFLSEQPLGAPNDDAVRELRRQKNELEDNLRIARQQLDDLRIEKERLERSLRALRNQLSPLHRALRAVFGEIELAIGEEIATPAATAAAAPGAPSTAAADPRWQSLKESFPGVPAKIVDALLVHRELTITQLGTVVKAHYDSVQKALVVLRKAGAVNQDGGKGGKFRLVS
jgi:hypothetical protein